MPPLPTHRHCEEPALDDEAIPNLPPSTNWQKRASDETVSLVTTALTLRFILLAGGMALDAVLEIGDPLVAVLGRDLGRPVLVALVASIIGQPVGVARRAGADAFLAVIKGQLVRPVKLGRRPGGRIVAGGAIAVKEAGVVGRLVVAGDALGRRPGKDGILVAAAAGHVQVPAIQGEGCLGVVEGDFFPGLGGVALGTVLTQFPGVASSS